MVGALKYIYMYRLLIATRRDIDPGQTDQQPHHLSSIKRLIAGRRRVRHAQRANQFLASALRQGQAWEDSRGNAIRTGTIDLSLGREEWAQQKGQGQKGRRRDRRSRGALAYRIDLPLCPSDAAQTSSRGGK